MPEQIANLTEASFTDSIAKGVTLVDFMAPWCPDCREQAPIYAKTASALAGKALVAKVNVDDDAKLSTAHGVKNIPTTILFNNGAEVQRFVGVQPEKTLVDAVEALLA